MGKKRDNKYRLKKQIQVNADLGSAAYVTAIVENSKRLDSDKETKANISLAFESLYSYVSMDFDIEFPDQQKEAISKIRKFETLLRNFRTAVEKEAKLQNKRSYKAIKDKKIVTKKR